MIEVTCEICGAIFVSRSSKAKYCSDQCRRQVQRSAAAKCRKRKGKAVSYGGPRVTVDDVLRFAENHRRATGEILSYGRAVAKMAASVSKTQKQGG